MYYNTDKNFMAKHALRKNVRFFILRLERQGHAKIKLWPLFILCYFFTFLVLRCRLAFMPYKCADTQTTTLSQHSAIWPQRWTNPISAPYRWHFAEWKGQKKTNPQPISIGNPITPDDSDMMTLISSAPPAQSHISAADSSSRHHLLTCCPSNNSSHSVWPSLTRPIAPCAPVPTFCLSAQWGGRKEMMTLGTVGGSAAQKTHIPDNDWH